MSEQHTVVYAVGTGTIACSCGLTFKAQRPLGATQFPKCAVTLWNEHRRDMLDAAKHDRA